VLICSGGSI